MNSCITSLAKYYRIICVCVCVYNFHFLILCTAKDDTSFPYGYKCAKKIGFEIKVRNADK